MGMPVVASGVVESEPFYITGGHGGGWGGGVDEMFDLFGVKVPSVQYCSLFFLICNHHT